LEIYFDCKFNESKCEENVFKELLHKDSRRHTEIRQDYQNYLQLVPKLTFKEKSHLFIEYFEKEKN